MVILLLALSVVTFALIELPPGDYATTFVEQLRQRGVILDDAQIEELRYRFGLGRPFYVKYWNWFSNFVQGDMGESFQYNVAVTRLIGERIGLTIALSLTTLFLAYGLAIPIGVYSAVRQYSIGDYIFTILGFIGLATPNFLLALILMFLTYKFFGWSVGGLFSPEYLLAPWSWAKVVDLLKHLPVPILVVGTAGTAELIRIMRSTLLDELGKQYVVTARVKGLKEGRLRIKYPIRMAINPLVSTVGYLLPAIISGETLVAIVLSLPTIGPLLLAALLAQDQFLAGSVIMILGALGIVGTLVSDILLVVVDPRIRFEAGEA
jgi:peptide/nickel transport system permease protein|tara:strand:+ start:2637 stop:3599 length:963 start_codon:yes stop_codon:yes gene_type:complete